MDEKNIVDSDMEKNIEDVVTDSLIKKIYILKNKTKHIALGGEGHFKRRSFFIEDILAALEMCDSTLVTVGKKTNITNEEAHEKANAYFMLQMKYDFLLEKILFFIDAIIRSDNLEVQERSNKNNKENTISNTQDLSVEVNSDSNSIVIQKKRKHSEAENIKYHKRQLESKQSLISKGLDEIYGSNYNLNKCIKNTQGIETDNDTNKKSHHINPWECNHCGERFNGKSALVTHKERHSSKVSTIVYEHLHSKQNISEQTSITKEHAYVTNKSSVEVQDVHQNEFLGSEWVKIFDNNIINSSLPDNDIIKSMRGLEMEDEENVNKIKESEQGCNNKIKDSSIEIQSKTTILEEEFDFEGLDEYHDKIENPLIVLKSDAIESVDHSNCTEETQMLNEINIDTSNIKVNITPDMYMHKNYENVEELDIDMSPQNTRPVVDDAFDNLGEHFVSGGIDDDSSSNYEINAHKENKNITGQISGLDLDQHYKLKELDEKSGICPQCFKPFYSSLKRHIEAVHLKVKRWKCDKCEKEFYDKGDLRKYQEHHDRSKTCYNCGKCGKSYFQIKSAQNHSNACTGPNKSDGQRPVCNICRRSLYDNHSLKRHMKDIHLKIKKQKPPPHCNECDIPFSAYNKLKKHRINKHGESYNELNTENINCPVEGCLFKHHQLGFVKSHMTRIHEIKDKIQCTICPFQCFSNKGMNSHLKSVHTVFTGHVVDPIQSSTTYMVKLEAEVKEEEVEFVPLFENSNLSMN